MKRAKLATSIAAICGLFLTGTVLAEETTEERLQGLENQIQALQLDLNSQSDTIDQQEEAQRPQSLCCDVQVDSVRKFSNYWVIEVVH